MRIYITLEKDGKYIQKNLTKHMVCTLYDLQSGLGDPDTKMETDLVKFFKIMGHIDSAMHGNTIGIWDPKTEKMIIRKMKGKEYFNGKPKWKPL